MKVKMNALTGNISGRLPRLAQATPWARAYMFALSNAGLFLLLSALTAMASATVVGISVAIALIFALGCIVGFGRLIRHGGALSPVAYFVLGSGIFFGLGTAYATISDGRAAVMFFSADVQQRVLPTLNLMNALSIFTVLLTAWPLARSGPAAANTTSQMRTVMSHFQLLRAPVIVLALPILIFMYSTFPQPENAVIGSLLNKVYFVPVVAIFLCCAQWRTIKPWERISAIALTVAFFIFGILSLSKTAAAMPFIGVFTGLWMNRTSRLVFFACLASMLVAYAGWIAPVCNFGRNHALYLPDDNTLAQRMTIVADTTQNRADYETSNRRTGVDLVARFSPAPIQAFLIQQHDRGVSGDTISDVWVAVIPRVLWRDKPMQRSGVEFDSLVFRREHSTSALAPTYSAEAFWNGGWIGLLLVSALVGLEVGWLTAKWNKLLREGTGLGIVIFSAPAIRHVAWLETWVVSTYVGGFATLLVLILLADMAIPIVLRLTLGVRSRLITPSIVRT